MATNYVKVTTSSSSQASELVSTILQLWDANARLTRLKAQADKMVVDDGTYALLATNFGVSSANGSDLYNLIAGALAITNGSTPTDLTQLMSRVGP